MKMLNINVAMKKTNKAVEHYNLCLWYNKLYIRKFSNTEARRMKYKYARFYYEEYLY